MLLKLRSNYSATGSSKMGKELKFVPSVPIVSSHTIYCEDFAPVIFAVEAGRPA